MTVPPPGGGVRHPLPAELVHDLRTPLSADHRLHGDAGGAGAADAGDDAYVARPAEGARRGRTACWRSWTRTSQLRPARRLRARPGRRTEAAPASGLRGPCGLADFIVGNREPILAEWEAFARTCTPASAPMDITALRDHANEMLTVIAAGPADAAGAGARRRTSPWARRPTTKTPRRPRPRSTARGGRRAASPWSRWSRSTGPCAPA